MHKRFIGKLLVTSMLICRAILVLLLGITVVSCSSGEPQPVDFYPEDECANCRMAISDPRFACEIIGKAQVLKFDDIGCMESYQRKNPNEQIRAIFYMDYARGSWLSYESAYVVQTGLLTPMNSGKVAVADTGSIQALGRSVGNPREAHP